MKRHLQFTLRFALLGTAVLAVALGVYVNTLHGRVRFLAKMKVLKAQIIYDSTDYGWEGRFAHWFGEDLVHPIWGVILTDIDDDDLAVLDSAPKLIEVCLWNSRITKDGIARLARLENLENLAIDSHHFAIRDLEPLAKLPQLTVLEIPATRDVASAQWLKELMPRCQIYFDEKWSESGDNADEGTAEGSPISK